MTRAAKVGLGNGPTDAQRQDIRRSFLCLAMAHEMRQPLNTINLNADLMEKRVKKLPMSEEVQQPLAVVLRSVERMTDLVEVWLDVVGPEQVPEARVDVWPVVAAAVKRAGSVDERGVRIALTPRGELPTVRAHELQLAVAVEAILENAVLASSSPGEVSVAVVQEGDHVRISITDRGPGMAPDVARRAVEIGFSTRRADGIGLTVAKFVAYHHGGGLLIDTRPGEGTIVTMSLPLD